MEPFLMDHLDIMTLDDSYDVEAMIAQDIDLFGSNAAVTAANEDGHLARQSSNGSTDGVEPRPKKINLSRKRQRDEIEYLRVKVGEMEQHLSELKQTTPSPRQTPSLQPGAAGLPAWQSMAHLMRAAKQSAVSENEKLRLQLQEQIDFSKSLQALLHKRPQLTLLPTMDSEQLLRLPKEPAALRRQTAFDICHQQYLQLPTVLAECGLLAENSGDFESYAPRLGKATEELILQVIVCRKEPEDFRVIGRLAWMLLNGSMSIDRRNHCCMEKFDANTVYVRLENRLQGMVNQTNFLIKRHIEDHRVLITARTILVDEAFPYDEEALVLNKCAWVLIEEDRVDGGCRLKFFQKSTLPMVQSSYVARHVPDDSSAHRFYRVGNVTDMTLSSLENMVSDFADALFNLLEELGSRTRRQAKYQTQPQ